MIALTDLPGRPCPAAAALDVIGERWSLLVVREVSMGEHRFEGIVAGTGASRDRVAARLKVLVEHGVLERRPYQSGPVRHEYHLTSAGEELVPIIRALRAWGTNHVVAADDPLLNRSARAWPEPDPAPGH